MTSQIASDLSGRSNRRRHWIASEIASLDPVTDCDRIVLLTANRLLPRVGLGVVFNLLYCLGFVRIAGQLEGARAVDRQGTGKVHKEPNRRAEDTIAHFTTWIQFGPSSAEGLASLRRVRGIHDHYAESYTMSDETFRHTIALFSLQFDRLLRSIGAAGYSEVERQAQVVHWRRIGDALGVQDMPATWEEMEFVLQAYESDPAWFGPSSEGRRCAEALISQFIERWFPFGARWAGRLLVRSLLEDHLLGIVGQPRPPRAFVWLIRVLARSLVAFELHVLPDRTALINPTKVAGAGTAFGRG
jgi:hypothetical protein